MLKKAEDETGGHQMTKPHLGNLSRYRRVSRRDRCGGQTIKEANTWVGVTRLNTDASLVAVDSYAKTNTRFRHKHSRRQERRP